MARQHTAMWLAHLKSKALVQGSTGQSKRMCHKQRPSYNSIYVKRPGHEHSQKQQTD